MWRIVPVTLALLTTLLCYALAGPTLGLFIGGTCFTAILVPPLVLWRDGTRGRLTVTLSVAGAVSAVWLVAVFSTISLVQWLACAATLIAFAVALMGIVMILSRLRVESSIASTLTTLLGLAWLGWPVWLSPHLVGPGATRAAALLVAPHPVFAVNGALRHLGAWTHQGVLYRISSLGQDVPYVLPSGVWPSVALHATVGALLIVLSMWNSPRPPAPDRRRAASPAGPPPTPPPAPAAP